MYCPRCGTKCDSNFRFCYRCGFLLPPMPDTAAPVYAEPNPPAEEFVPTEVPVNDPAPLAGEYPPPAAPVHYPAMGQYPVTGYIPVQQFSSVMAEPIPAPPPKKGKLWPPLLILIIMMTAGLLAFLFMPQIPDSNLPTPNETPWFSVEDGVLEFDKSLYDGDSELEVPSTVNGQTVTALGKSCFKGCSTLTTVILPDTLTEIQDNAFSNCTNMRGIYIPDGVTHIGSSAFSNCAALEAIHLPESVTSIEDRAFIRCPNLKHVFFAGTYHKWEKAYDGTLPEDAWIYCTDGNYPYIGK